MRIHTVKKGIRSNHTIRWGGYNQEGTKRNGIINGTFYVDKHMSNIFTNTESDSVLPKKYAKYFPQEITSECVYTDSSDTRPAKHDVIKFDSTVRCCQMCGGTRFGCKALFQETNQYGKGCYTTKKIIDNPLNDYDDYLASIDDFNEDCIDPYYDD